MGEEEEKEEKIEKEGKKQEQERQERGCYVDSHTYNLLSQSSAEASSTSYRRHGVPAVLT